MKGELATPPLHGTTGVFGYSQFGRMEPLGWRYGQVCGIAVGWVRVAPGNGINITTCLVPSIVPSKWEACLFTVYVLALLSG